MPVPLPTALLQWIRTFPLTPPPTTLTSLRTGHALSQLLHDIDPSFFPPSDNLPSSAVEADNNWVARWQNLKAVEKGLAAYERDVCGIPSHSSTDDGEGRRGGEADLKAIAQAKGEEAEGDIVVLLKRILRAGMYSPASNQRMGRVVVGLGAEVAGVIASAMAGMEEPYDSEEPEGGREQGEEEVFGETNGAQGKKAERDIELEAEEQLIHAHRIIRQLEESNAKAATELEELRAEKKRVEDSFEALQFESSNGTTKRPEDESLRDLRDRADRDRDYIAELESELESAREAAASAERNSTRLKEASAAQQKLKDDVQLLRAERDDLLSKTRANENLRKKIQNLQDAERATSTMREDLRAAQEEAERLRGMEKKVEGLMKAQQENMNIIANTEQEIFDQKTTRKRLEHELRVLQQKYEIARERQERDREVIAELEGRVGEAEGGGRPGLDREMSRAEKMPSRSASFALPTKQGGDGNEVAMLEERLKALNLRTKGLEEQYLDVLGDKLGLETTLADLNDPAGKGSEEGRIAYIEQRNKLTAATDEAKKLQEEIHRLTAELASTKEKIISGAGADTIDSAKEYAALSAEYGTLTKHAEGLGASLEESRALLRFALLSARGINMDDEELRKSQEYELVRRLLDEVRQAENDDVVVDVGNRVVGRIEGARMEGAAASKELRKRDAEIHTLKKQLEESSAAHQKALDAAKQSSTKDSGTVPDAEDQKAMAQLKRENQLMSSAWFDLTSRIQRDNVILGRRRESPKSWLGKQRAAVGLGIGGK